SARSRWGQGARARGSAVAAVARSRAAALGWRIGRGWSFGLWGRRTATMGLPSRTSWSTRKSKNFDHAEWVRRTDAGAWSLAHDVKPSWSAFFVRSWMQRAPEPSTRPSMRPAMLATSRRYAVTVAGGL